MAEAAGSAPKRKADPIGVVLVVLVTLAVFGGMWVTAQIVSTQGEATTNQIDGAVRQLAAENRELRGLLRAVLAEVRQSAARAAAQPANPAQPVEAGAPAVTAVAQEVPRPATPALRQPEASAAPASGPAEPAAAEHAHH